MFWKTLKTNDPKNPKNEKQIFQNIGFYTENKTIFSKQTKKDSIILAL